MTNDKHYAQLHLNSVHSMIAIADKMLIINTEDSEMEVAQQDLEEINILLHQTKARLNNVINRK